MAKNKKAPADIDFGLDSDRHATSKAKENDDGLFVNNDFGDEYSEEFEEEYEDLKQKSEPKNKTKEAKDEGKKQEEEEDEEIDPEESEKMINDQFDLIFSQDPQVRELLGQNAKTELSLE